MGVHTVLATMGHISIRHGLWAHCNVAKDADKYYRIYYERVFKKCNGKQGRTS
jgi:hypothetical protein